MVMRDCTITVEIFRSRLYVLGRHFSNNSILNQCAWLVSFGGEPCTEVMRPRANKGSRSLPITSVIQRQVVFLTWTGLKAWSWTQTRQSLTTHFDVDVLSSHVCSLYFLLPPPVCRPRWSKLWDMCSASQRAVAAAAAAVVLVHSMADLREEGLFPRGICCGGQCRVRGTVPPP